MQDAIPAAHRCPHNRTGPSAPCWESCIYGYRRNFSMFFISSSVFLLNSCFHTHSCSEKCRGRNSSTPLTDFLQVKCSCLAVSFSRWPGVVCSRGAPPSMTVSISMTSIRPLGSAAVQSPIWFKNKGKEKTNKKNLLSPSKGATQILFKACLRLGDNVL